MLRKGFLGWRLVLTNRLGVGVVFADQSVAVTTSRLIGGRAHPESDGSRFMAAYVERWPETDLIASAAAKVAQPASRPENEYGEGGQGHIPPLGELGRGSLVGSLGNSDADLASTQAGLT